MLEKIISIIKNNIFKIFMLFLIVALYIFNYLTFINLKASKKESNENIISEVALGEEKEDINEVIEYIYVDIKGAVKKPNVYKLLKGTRVVDAVKSAGGINKNANTRFINLSKVLNDGDVIVIYTNDEIKKAKKTEKIIVETPCVCEEIKNDACYKESKETINNDNSLSTNEDSSNKYININTATIDELITLSGIGESKAKAIIKYREDNGKFNNIEDIVKVSGISETIFSKIKNNITV